MKPGFSIEGIAGLSEKEAAAQLALDGFNELPSSRKRGILAIAWNVVREPMFLLLVACGIIYLISGDIQEAAMLLFFVFAVMGIALYQERKTERALEALRDLSSPRALVIRDSKEKRIAGRDVAMNDIIVLNEGDRVPADAEILSSSNLLVDESLLTGESAPVRKSPAKGKTEYMRPGGEDTPFVYSSTLVVQGRGVARVRATGINTEIGVIGKSMLALEPEATGLQKETRRVVRQLAAMGLLLCILLVVGYGFTRGDWKQGFLAGITLAMATLPEEFPVVLTIFFALGAWRMARKNVLTRRVPTIETLGSATVLCVDKTGTLTMNRMSVKKMVANSETYDVNGCLSEPLPETFHELVEFSILASQRYPFDPMEKAIKQLGEQHLARTEHLHRDWTLVHEYPLSRELLALSHVWESPDGADFVIAAKGAPEAIADLCHFNSEEMDELSYHISALAKEGLRVIGAAKSSFHRTALPDIQHGFPFEFLGLIGLADHVRPSVPDAVKECNAAGIRVIMITGDYPGTAQNIARQIGLSNAHLFLTGAELSAMMDEELRRRIREICIFARVVPEQKLRIVNALKAEGEIVAMTGDGVNDAPALKAAHIGIAMGARGTDVAREAASLVLLDDDFSSIVQAVRMGRRIYDNIKKAIAYIFAIHVPIAGMSLLPALCRLPLALLPVHIVFLELIIDPACSVVFEAEPEESGIMERPPRSPKEKLFNRRTLALGIAQGVAVLIIVLTVFLIAHHIQKDANEARALTFTTLIIANLGLIMTNRSWTRNIWDMLRTTNNALWWVIGGAAAFLALVLYTPFLRSLFRFSYLHPTDIAICICAGAVSALWFETMKFFRSRSRHLAANRQ